MTRDTLAGQLRTIRMQAEFDAEQFRADGGGRLRYAYAEQAMQENADMYAVRTALAAMATAVGRAAYTDTFRYEAGIVEPHHVVRRTWATAAQAAG